MKTEKNSLLGLYMVGIAALFLAGFFLLVLFGAQTYRNTVVQQNGNGEVRSLQSYLTNCIGSGDAAEAVQYRDAEKLLMIRDGNSSYALKIYHRDGAVLEEYARINVPLDPENANEIARTEAFEVEELRPGTLRFKTDEGSFLVNLRSSEGISAW